LKINTKNYTNKIIKKYSDARKIIILM